MGTRAWIPGFNARRKSQHGGHSEYTDLYFPWRVFAASSERLFYYVDERNRFIRIDTLRSATREKRSIAKTIRRTKRGRMGAWSMEETRGIDSMIGSNLARVKNVPNIPPIPSANFRKSRYTRRRWTDERGRA